MISFRQADLIPSMQEATTPPVDVDFILTFPTQNNGNEHGMKNGRYYAITEIHIKIPAGDIATNNRILDRVEKAMFPYAWGDIYSSEGETYDDFNKRLRDTFKAQLAPISDVPPTHTAQSTGRYQWIIHLKIKPIKK